jgi:hypothetical protein
MESEAIFSTLDHRACRTDLGLPDSTCRLDIDDDRSFEVDQVIVGIGEEGMPLVSAGPLRGRIRSRDELWYRLARCAPGRFVQRVEVLADGSPCLGERFPVMVVGPRG